MIKEKLKLFTTGFIQILFVSVNTVFLAKTYYFGVLIAAFMISYIWSWNVKKVAFGDHLDRLIYAIGAAIGSVSGLFISEIFIK